MKLLLVTLSFVSVLAAVSVADLPDCSYPDPAVETTTCRQLAYGTVAGDDLPTCSYYWCDTSVACPTDGNKKKEKERKKWPRKVTPLDGSPVYYITRYLPLDSDTGRCCNCKMPPVGPGN